MVEIKDRLQELMRYFGIKQVDLAERAGLPKSAVSMYVSGNRIPRQNKISQIADAYGVDPAWILGYNVSMFPGEPPQPSDPEDVGVLIYRLLAEDKPRLDKLFRAYDKLKSCDRDKLVSYALQLHLSYNK